MCEITIYSTRKGEASKFNTSATTWGELRKELYKADLYNEKMKAVLSTNKMTLENDDVVLPDGGYTIFMVPKETKSGVGFSVEKVKSLQADMNTLFESVIQGATTVSAAELRRLQKEADAILAGLSAR